MPDNKTKKLQLFGEFPSDTDKPSPPDWNAAEGEPGYIANRPFYSELEEKILVSETTIEPESEWDYGYISGIYEDTLPIGTEVIVTFDGVDYVCRVEPTYPGNDAVGIGNHKEMYDDEEHIGNGEPFAIDLYGESDADVYCREPGTHTVSIHVNVETAHTINEKFIPNTIARTCEAPHKQLVTDEYGNTVWEDRPYKTDRIVMKLDPNRDAKSEAADGTQKWVCEYNDSNPEHLNAAIFAIGREFFENTNKHKDGYVFYFDGVQYEQVQRRLPFIVKYDRFTLSAVYDSSMSKTKFIIEYYDNQPHTFELMLAEPEIRKIDVDLLPEATPPSDWNAAEGEPGHITNRPFYVENGETIISNLSFEIEDLEWSFYETIGDGGFEEHDSVTVVWDGVEYSDLTAYYCEWYMGPAVGNPSMCGDEGAVDNGLPFHIITYGDGDYEIFASTVGKHTVSVTVYKVNTLNEKFLPVGISPGVGKNAEVFNGGLPSHASGCYSHAQGCMTVASGDYSNAQGNYSKAIGEYSVAIGNNVVAEYANVQASGVYNVYNDATYIQRTYEGTVTIDDKDVGYISNDFTFDGGSGTFSLVDSTQITGQPSKLPVYYSEVEGAASKIYYVTKESYTNNTISWIRYSCLEYRSQEVATSKGPYIHVVGNGVSDDKRSNAHTLDWDGNAWFAGNVHIGGTGQDDSFTIPGRIVAGKTFDVDGTDFVAKDGAEVFNAYSGNSANFAIGQNSHAEGRSTRAIGDTSHAEGDGATATGDYSHAEGNDTFAFGVMSHAEGLTTMALGDTSHAEGYATIAYGSDSHAGGYDTFAFGDYSHAEGGGSFALGDASHAEGRSTRTIGDTSHAEGWHTVAVGDASHAQGRFNSIGSFVSRVENKNGDFVNGLKDPRQRGVYSIADYYTFNEITGQYSLCDNLGNVVATISDLLPNSTSKYFMIDDIVSPVMFRFTNIISYDETSVQAEYEYYTVTSESGVKYAHIVGNGTSNDNRSNAHTLDWDGNAWFAGNVTVGEDNKELATKEYVDEQLSEMGGGLPSGNAPLQQLVTDAEGNAVWEDKLCYQKQAFEPIELSDKYDFSKCETFTANGTFYKVADHIPLQSASDLDRYVSELYKAGRVVLSHNLPGSENMAILNEHGWSFGDTSAPAVNAFVSSDGQFVDGQGTKYPRGLWFGEAGKIGPGGAFTGTISLIPANTVKPIDPKFLPETAKVDETKIVNSVLAALPIWTGGGSY